MTDPFLPPDGLRADINWIWCCPEVDCDYQEREQWRRAASFGVFGPYGPLDVTRMALPPHRTEDS
jgi:hypothetical protein